MEKLHLSYIKHHFISEEFSPTRPLFAGHQADELLLHYSTTTDLLIALCSLLSFHKSLLSFLEDTDVKSHDKALL